ncbi:MAG: glycosyltransferase [Anaerolineaceae bacterium]|nr:glycosyltransferase [Anaerolineaceae bacterium]
MRFLIVTSLHHPEQLQAAIAATPPGESPPLFPPSMAQHFWAKALRKRGHTVDAFFRNLPAWGGGIRAQRHTGGITPGKVLAALGHRVPPQINPDYRLRNRHLLDKARAFQPDVLWLVGDNTVILPETLAAIKRETGCKLLYSTGTSPIVFSLPVERAAARLYDLVLVNDYYHGVQWLELGARDMACLPVSACDPDFHHPYPLTDAERAEYACDVAFVGTLIPDHLYSRRVAALAALADFDLGIWSVHDVPAGLRRFVRGAALGADMLRILSAAKVTINVHGDFMRYGGNMRLFEAAGSGVFQIADDLPGTREWFTEGETIVTYRDLDDLRVKVAYYLAHEDERQAIIQQAQAHVYAHHTYDQRIARIETLLDG